MTQIPRIKRTGGRIAAAAIVVGALAYLFYGGLGDNIVYFLTPAELLARGPSAVDVPVRLGGQVVPGSVSWDAKRLDLRFRVTDGVRDVAVQATGAPPQMFREGMGVVVEGRYGTNDVFRSSTLMVRHSNEYRSPKPGHEPAALYKTLIREGTP